MTDITTTNINTTQPSGGAKPVTTVNKLGGVVFNKAELETKVWLNINEIGPNMIEILQKRIAAVVHNRCQKEGYIRSDTIHIKTYSAGVVKGVQQIFTVIYECLVCYPTEGMIIDDVECVNISIAGIHAIFRDDASDTIPLHIYLLKDFHYGNDQFDSIKEGDRFQAKIIGIDYKLLDPYITASAMLYSDTKGGEIDGGADE
jgi:DNA-directed RNA polymerase subunit E'/Rpb7